MNELTCLEGVASPSLESNYISFRFAFTFLKIIHSQRANRAQCPHIESLTPYKGLYPQCFLEIGHIVGHKMKKLAAVF